MLVSRLRCKKTVGNFSFTFGTFSEETHEQAHVFSEHPRCILHFVGTVSVVTVARSCTFALQCFALNYQMWFNQMFSTLSKMLMGVSQIQLFYSWNQSKTLLSNMNTTLRINF